MGKTEKTAGVYIFLYPPKKKCGVFSRAGGGGGVHSGVWMT